MSLSASLKNAGHETSLVFFQNDPLNKDKIVKALKRESPDFIAFSFMSGVKEHYIDLAGYIKEHISTPIVIGGLHQHLTLTYVILMITRLMQSV